MSTYQTRLSGREEIAEGTMAFHFEKPVGFSFKPGQAIDVVLRGPATADAQSSRHTFSLVTAPFQDELVVATRMRDSAFKDALGSLSVGSPVNLEGAFGSLVLHNSRARPGVFIAGGIGITPRPCRALPADVRHPTLRCTARARLDLLPPCDLHGCSCRCTGGPMSFGVPEAMTR